MASPNLRGLDSLGADATLAAKVYDQFRNSVSPQPALSWGTTAGEITSGGVFSPPPLSEPCQVTVSGGGASASAAVNVVDPSPLVAGRVGDNWIEQLFEQAIGSPSVATGTTGTGLGLRQQLHLHLLTPAAMEPIPTASAGRGPPAA